MSASGLRRLVRYGLLRLPTGVRRRGEIRLLRLYEAYLRLRSRSPEQPLDASGTPVPPARLRVLVSGTPDPEYFLDTGRRHSEWLRGMLERNGTALEDLSAILDFGCGCGRNARWWAGLRGPALYGCDPNPDLVRWCQTNLPFLDAAVSGAEPPLPYADATFDFVYAFSVFTHLPERQALAWMTELRRVLKPGGSLIFTTAGESYREGLSRLEAQRYARGEEVIQFDTASGTNLCIAYHSPAYVRSRMLAGYELVEAFLSPERAAEAEEARLPHDGYLVRVPLGAPGLDGRANGSGSRL